MNIEEIEQYIKNKPMVCKKIKKKRYVDYSINGKTFAIISKDSPSFITLKNKPYINNYLRNNFDFVFPSYYFFNKTYWNTIAIVDELDKEALFKMIDQSYNMSFERMTKKQKLYFYYNTKPPPQPA